MRSPGLKIRRIVLVLSVGYVRRWKEVEVELEQLRQLVVAMMGREEVVCASGSGGGNVGDKVEEMMREMLRRA